jgi:hypothetical protein
MVPQHTDGMMAENGANSGPQTDNEAIAAEVRGLLRRATVAALASIGAPPDAATAGWPSNALVTLAAAPDGSPILLLSTLAHHTRNLLADARAGLLIEETAGFANPQAGPRVTAMGRIVRTDTAGLARRFLARHPAAKVYAGFGDFAFYTMAVERFHFVAGFARARWIDAGEVILPTNVCAEIAAVEADLLAHMNDDHAETLLLYAQRFLKVRAKRVSLISVDPDGFDLRCGRTLRRVAFPVRVESAEQIRRALITLAETARARV